MEGGLNAIFVWECFRWLKTQVSNGITKWKKKHTDGHDGLRGIFIVALAVAATNPTPKIIFSIFQFLLFNKILGTNNYAELCDHKISCNYPICPPNHGCILNSQKFFFTEVTVYFWHLRPQPTH